MAITLPDKLDNVYRLFDCGKCFDMVGISTRTYCTMCTKITGVNDVSGTAFFVGNEYRKINVLSRWLKKFADDTYVIQQITRTPVRAS